MQCPQCGTENSEDAKFCRQCGTSLALNCPHCNAPLSPGDRFCSNCGQAVALSTPVTEQETITPTSQEKIGPGELSRDRKVVTILFADVVGSTTIAESMDPEEWTAIIDRAFERLTPPIYQYEGNIARLLGDALLALFGAPVAHEDDAIRAVHAGLDLLRAARDYANELRQQYSFEFALRIGINTGLVVVGTVGTDLKNEYTAMGDAVNLAARLQTAARPMSLMISETTYRYVHTFFDCIDLGEIDVRGKAKPVRVYEVTGLRADVRPQRGMPGAESSLVGRDAEMATLRQLSKAVVAGVGRTVVILGEAGLGKSRLVAAWREQQSLRSVEGQCLSFGQGRAYHLVTSLLRSLLSVTPAAGAEETLVALRDFTARTWGTADLDTYPYLAHLLGLPLEGEAAERVSMLDPQTVPARYAEAVQNLLLSVTAVEPLIVLCEDIHWADPSSVDVLTRLLPLARRTRLMFCFTMRPERDVPGWQLVASARDTLGSSLTEIELSPLSQVDTQRLASELLDMPALPQPVQHLIHEKAEGNPFFVEEVIRMLVEHGVLVRQDGRWLMSSSITAFDVPDNLMGLLLARIDRLPEDVKRTLRLASVVGREFSTTVLDRVLEADEAASLLARLSELEAAGLIQLIQVEPELQYAFRHGLVQDAAYGSLLKRDRQRLHGAVAQALEALYPERGVELAAELGHHFLEAGNPTAARNYLLTAAENAARRYANIEAIAYYTQLLAVTDTDEAARSELFLARGATRERLGLFDLAREDDEAALETARRLGDQGAEWNALIALGALWAGKDYRQTGLYYQQAFELAQRMEDDARIASALNRLGNWHTNRDEPDQGRAMHEEALALFEQRQDSFGVLETVDLLAMANLIGGDIRAAARHYEQSSRLADQLNVQPLLVQALVTPALFVVFADLASVDETTSFEAIIRDVTRSIEIARAIGWRSGETYALIHYGGLLGRTGDFGRGLAKIAEAYAIAQAIGHEQWQVFARIGEALLYLDMRAYAKARTALEAALASARNVGSVYWARLIGGHLTSTYVALGEIDLAERLLQDTAVDTLPPNTFARRQIWLARAEIALARKQFDQAMRDLDALLADTPRLAGEGEESVLAIAYLRGRTLLEMLDASPEPQPALAQRAESLLRTASQTAEARRLTPLAWQIRLTLSRLYQFLDRREEAEQERQQAYRILESLVERAPTPELQADIRAGALNLETALGIT